MQEKLEYQLEERTRDMQELLLTCQTKVGLLLMLMWHPAAFIAN